MLIRHEVDTRTEEDDKKEEGEREAQVATGVPVRLSNLGYQGTRIPSAAACPPREAAMRADNMQCL